MNIKQINFSQTFGKTPVMRCEMKKTGTKDKAQSTLYKLNPQLNSDLEEVMYSKRARCMYTDMRKDSQTKNPYREYYILKDDKTDEVISCAETSHHYRAENVPHPGLSTLIDEMESNGKYVSSQEPLLAYLAYSAMNRFDDSVCVGFYNEDYSRFKRARFSETKNGDWILPDKRYINLIDNAAKRYNIEFLV